MTGMISRELLSRSFAICPHVANDFKSCPNGDINEEVVMTRMSAIATAMILSSFIISCSKVGDGTSALTAAQALAQGSTDCPVITPPDNPPPDNPPPDDPPIHINAMAVSDPCQPPGLDAGAALAECDPSPSDLLVNGGEISVLSGTNSFAVQSLDSVQTISGKLSLKGITDADGNRPAVSSIKNISGTLVICNLHVTSINVNSAQVLLVGSVVDNLVDDSGEIRYYQSEIGNKDHVSGKLIELH